jgi:Trk K+ transport system NAD-binding subunit
MNTTRRKARDEPDESAQNVLVVGGSHFGLAVAEYLTEGAQSVTFVSEEQPSHVPDGVTSIHRKISDANDVRSLASEITDIDLVVVVGGPDSQALLLGYLARRELDPPDVVTNLSNPTNDPAFEGTGVDRIDMPRLLAEQIRDRYK